MIRFKCLECNALIQVEDKYGGGRGNCPHCGKLIEIPPATIVPEELVSVSPADVVNVYEKGHYVTMDTFAPGTVFQFEPKTSILAVLSFLFSIIGVTVILSIILGIIALMAIRKNQNLKGSELAWAGIIISGIWILAAPILLTLFLHIRPAFS